MVFTVFSRNNFFSLQAVPDTYTLLDLDKLPSLPSVETFTLIANNGPSNPLISPQLAKHAGDVGITECVTKGNKVVNFSLIFPLEKFQDPLSHNHVKNFDPAFLLGRIPNLNPSGLERIIELSRMSHSLRDGITFRLSFE